MTGQEPKLSTQKHPCSVSTAPSAKGLRVGWALHKDDLIAWQQIDWAEKLALTLLDWFATHFRQQKDAIETITITLGLCWPLSPVVHARIAAIGGCCRISTQGINMTIASGYQI